MTAVNYAALNAFAQAQIDAYMELFDAAGKDPSNVPMPIPKVLWDEESWMQRVTMQKDMRERITVFINGERPFRILPKQYPEFILIGAGVPDASGRNNAKYNLAYRRVTPEGKILKSGRDYLENPGTPLRLVGLPGINAFDITNDYVWDQPDEEAIMNLMAYDLSVATIETDPATWPEAFREPFMAGHPGFVFTGRTEYRPWIPGTVNPF